MACDAGHQSHQGSPATAISAIDRGVPWSEQTAAIAAAHLPGSGVHRGPAIGNSYTNSVHFDCDADHC
jgi:hypothetical protein